MDIIDGLIKSSVPHVIGFVLTYLSPGTACHGVLQTLYIKTFDVVVRQGTYVDIIKDFENTDIENPRVVSRNRRPMTSNSKSFPTTSDAVSYWKSRVVGYQMSIERSDLLYLTGRAGSPDRTHGWLFLLVGDPDSCPAQWESLQNDDKDVWNEVALPAHWQLQGYDVPLYTNTGYPFQFDPPRARRNGSWLNTACDVGCGGTTVTGKEYLHPNEPGVNATGLFQRTLRLSEQWKDLSKDDERIFLVFEGADSCLSIWVNGIFVGYSQDSCLAAEFDVTAALAQCAGGDGDWRSAEHSLAVKVSRWCDGSYLEDQDKWWLSGIYREVYLVRRPAAFIADFEFTADISPMAEGLATSAAVTIGVLAEGVATVADQLQYAVRAALYDTRNSNTDSPPVLVLSGSLSGGSDLPSSRHAQTVDTQHREVNCDAPSNQKAVAVLTGSLLDVSLWTADTPNLYTLVVTLHRTLAEAESGSNHLHLASTRVGVRSVTIDGPDHCLRVNERPLVIAGVNRHEFEADSGRAVSESSMCRDAILLKSLNFNAVRSSHYPNHPYWLEVCDEVGLYVIDEANIETHGFQMLGQPVGYLASLPEWRGAMSDRVVRMLERDKNNACVIGWSLGNECGFGPTHDIMANWLRLRDPRRFLQYESGGACTSATDIICPMYLRPSWCREQSVVDAQQRPVILCEYAHAMGNSGGCLAQYWRDFWDPALPRLQGGFIWDFADQGLLLPASEDGEKRFGYGGDFGDFPNTKQFCCNGIFGADRRPHTTAIEAAFLQAPLTVSLQCSVSGDATLVVTNRRSHSDLSDLTLELTVQCALTELHSTVQFRTITILLNKYLIGAGAQSAINISSALWDVLAAPVAGDWATSDGSAHFNQTAWLDVTVRKSADPSRPWLPEHIVLRTSLESAPLLQLILASQKASVPVRTAPSSLAPVELREETQGNGERLLTVAWSNGSSAIISVRTGLLLSWRNAKGSELLASHVEVCVFRAGTDNDRGGMMTSYYARWKDAGLDRLQQRFDNNKAGVESWVLAGDGSVQVQASWDLAPSQTADASASIACAVTYTFTASGDIQLSCKVTPGASLPPLPRCGLRFSVDGGLSQARWLGLGPHENYDDRKESAYLGVFDSSVDALHETYVFPAECGRRSDIRWLTLSNSESGTSLAAVPLPKTSLPSGVSSASAAHQGFGFSASRFSLEALETAEHDFELQTDEDRRVHVHLDSYMMGVAGYDSWSPNVDSEFTNRTTGEDRDRVIEINVLLADNSI